MPLYPLPWQDPASVAGQQRRSMLSELGSRLRMAQDRLAELRRADPNGLLPGYKAVVADMLALKAELEPLGFVYTIPDHLRDYYDANFAPRAPQRSSEDEQRAESIRLAGVVTNLKSDLKRAEKDIEDLKKGNYIHEYSYRFF